MSTNEEQCSKRSNMSERALTKNEMNGLLKLVRAGDGTTSMELATMLANSLERHPTPDDHDSIGIALKQALDKGLVSASQGIYKHKTTVFSQIRLTETGERQLDRSQHRFWWLSTVCRELKDFAATVLSKLFSDG